MMEFAVVKLRSGLTVALGRTGLLCVNPNIWGLYNCPAFGLYFSLSLGVKNSPN
jgi:hypothetical protein